MSRVSFMGKSIFAWMKQAACVSSSPVFRRIINRKDACRFTSRPFCSLAVMERTEIKDFVGKQQEKVDDSLLDHAAFVNSVFEVICIKTPPGRFRPWQKGIKKSLSSAFTIGDGMLLTNAHCVRHYLRVTVKRERDNIRYPAKVLAVGVACDLALLSVDSEEFLKGAGQPQRFGSLPERKDAVTVFGYPAGGEGLSITKGIVSRLEVKSYGTGKNQLLRIQIDAAVNPGNSGGPALNERGEVIGVVFQGYSSLQNTGYLIPTPVIFHFLEDYKRNGKYTGLPWLEIRFQKLENPALCEYLNVPSNEGLLVRGVEGPPELKKVLKKGDVIISVDGAHIGKKETEPFRSTEKDVDFQYLISQKFVGDSAQLGIIREGKFMEVPVLLKALKHSASSQPSFLTVGGMLCKPEYEREYYESDDEYEYSSVVHVPYSRVRTQLARPHDSSPKSEDRQKVILHQVLTHDVNIGYEYLDKSEFEVKKLNGTRVKNIRHLAHLVDSCMDKFLIFELKRNHKLVLNREDATASSPQILKDYGAPERSEDLLVPYQEAEPDSGESSLSYSISPKCEVSSDLLEKIKELIAALEDELDF